MSFENAGAPNAIGGYGQKKSKSTASQSIRDLETLASAHNGAAVKPTNPKDAVGVLKAPLSYVPMTVLMELGVAMLEGGHKYGRHNYRVVGVRSSIYFDATIRHLAAWWEGEDLDPDSKGEISHITKAIASLVVLRDCMMQGRWTDDRPPKALPAWLQVLEAEVKQLNKQYPDPKPYHTERGT